MGKASRGKRAFTTREQRKKVVEPMVDLCAVPCSWSQLIRHFDGCKADLVCDGAPNDRSSGRLEGPNKAYIPFQAVW